MAELSYTDIQRAVRESLLSLQNSVQYLTSNLGAVSSRATHINDIEVLVRDLQRNLQLVQANMLVLKQSLPTDQQLLQMTKDIHDLKNRFAAMEKFAIQMTAYVRNQEELLSEDRQYRSA